MKRRKFIKQVMTVSLVALSVPSMVFSKSDSSTASTPTMKNLNSISYEDAIKLITKGKEVKESGTIKFKVPAIAENPAVVPIKITVESPMTEEEYVKAIYIFNTKNSNSRCMAVNLTPLNRKAFFAVRVKLAETQEVIALVELSNGTFIKATKSVKVTGGSC